MNRKQLTVACILILSFSIATQSYSKETLLPEEIIDSWHNQALRLKNEGKYNEAETLFKHILRCEPTNANANFDLGNVTCTPKTVPLAIG